MTNFVKVTDKDFNIFKTWVIRWVDMLGLRNWTFYICKQSKEDWENETSRGFACVFRDLANSVATIELCYKWENSLLEKSEESLIRLSFHEVCHLLLTIKRSEDCLEGEEDIIHSLENFIFGIDKINPISRGSIASFIVKKFKD